MSDRRHLPLYVDARSTTPLPSLLARWVDQAFGALPNETRATCDDCVMCRPDVDLDDRFLPDVRCCGFTPPLPNYAVGAILSGDGVTERGRAAVANRVSRRIGATPLGLDPPRRYAAAYEASTTQDFGRRRDLVCPFFEPDGAACGIWAHRMSMCATWFCRHEQRALGFRAWNALKSFLWRVEQEVAELCLRELDFDCTNLFPVGERQDRGDRLLKASPGGWSDPDGALDDRTARRLWGAWYGREVELYRACAGIAESLEWPRIRQIGGAPLLRAEQVVRSAWRVVRDHSVPATLAWTNIDARPLDDGRWRLQTDETPFDPLIVAAEVHSALELFDGRRTADAVRTAAERGAAFDDETVRLLVHHGILAAPDDRDLAPRDRGRGPVSPETQLCFFRGYRRAAVTSKLTSDDAGTTALVVSCGPKEITFDEPDLISFGENLCAFQDGFRARDAMAWSAGEQPYEWEHVRRLLEALVDENVLQIIPTESSPG